MLPQIARFVLTVLAIGLPAHFLGEKLPRNKFDPTAFPYAPYRWENGGRIYLKTGIQKWKEMLPDKSRFARGTYRKSVGTLRSSAHMLRLAQETCVAEFVHWALLVVSPVMLWTMNGIASVVAALLYGLSNIPFIMIQRYNRPRLMKLYERLVQQQK